MEAWEASAFEVIEAKFVFELSANVRAERGKTRRVLLAREYVSRDTREPRNTPIA